VVLCVDFFLLFLGEREREREREREKEKGKKKGKLLGLSSATAGINSAWVSWVVLLYRKMV
jgi:hypothetical protein